MGTRSRTRKLPGSVRRELEVAAAIAREAVFATHAARAEALIQLAGDRVSPTRMLQIYVRLHGLAEQDALFLSNRVLAEIGRRAAKGRAAPAAPFVEGETPEEEQESASLLRHIRNRLRGRVLHELRRGVELYAGVTEVAMLKMHVKHALRFYEILQPTGESVAGALALYREALAVRQNQADTLYYFVLERLAVEQPPVPQPAETVTPPQPAEAAHAAAGGRTANGKSAGRPTQPPARLPEPAGAQAPQQPELYKPNGRDDARPRARAVG